MNRRDLSAVVAVAGLVAVLAACSSAGSAPAPASPPAASLLGPPASAQADAGTPSGTAMPGDVPTAGGAASTTEGEHDDAGHGHGSSGGGLTASEHGLTLQVPSVEFPSGKPAGVSFSIDREDGSAITGFEIVHEKPLHLLVVRNDLTNYVHAHPEMAPDGTWSTVLPVLPDGTYRILADFMPTEHPMGMLLGTEIVIGDPATAAPSGEFSRTDTVDGITAELVGDTAHEDSSALKVVLTRDGKPVTSVSPYLGAGGHFVAFGSDDLGAVHMHSNSEQPDASGALTFTAPPLGHVVYHGFVQVDIDGSVKTFNLGWKGE